MIRNVPGCLAHAIATACALLLVSTGSVAAQTSANGSIRGYVRDAQDAVLPGVTITASSPTVAGVRTTVSDGHGFYRLIEVPPGEYTIVAELAGFSKFERAGVAVRAGLNIGLEIVVAVGTVTETVQVSSETPMLEVDQPSQGVNIDGAFQRALPTSGRRDYTDFLEMTPGVASYVSPSRGAGLYHMRGSRIESHVIQVDGADMGSLRQARPDYVGMSTDTLGDVEVKSSVSDASAPLGQGAVVNIATPTGSNVVKGSLSTAYTHRDWHADNNPGGETNSSSLALFDASLGGPVVRDRSWFFGSFRRIARNIGVNRTAEQIALNRALLGSDWQSFDNGFDGTFAYAKSTTQLGRHRFEAFYQMDHSPTEANNAREALNTDISVFGGEGYSARLASVWGNSVTTRVSASYNNKALSPTRSDFEDHIVAGLPQRLVHASTRISSGLIVGTGELVNIGNQTSYSATPSSKVSLTGDLTWYRRGWLGSHELQTGFYLQPWLRGSTTQINTNGGFVLEEVVLRDRTNPAAGYAPFHRQLRDPVELLTSDLRASDNAVYVQESWRPSERLTVTAGVRFDHITGRDLLTEVETQNSLQVGPRFGATYALTGDGQNIVHASWGRIHDLVLLGDIPTTGSASATVIDRYDNDLDGVFETERVNPGSTQARRDRVIDPDRHQPYADEWAVGYRRQFRGQLSLTAEYAQREYRHRSVLIDQNIIYDNGVFRGYREPSLNAINLDTNNIWNWQVYQAIEVALAKRSKQIQFIASYVRQWRHLEGTWVPNDPASIIQPDAFPNDKAIGTPRATPSSSLPPGGSDTFGNTAWRDHTARLSVIYNAPWQLQLGAHYVYQSGPYTGPIVTRIDTADPRFGPASLALSNGRIVANPLATTVRLAFATRGEGQVQADARQELNLKATRAFSIGRYRVEAGFDVFNVTNQGAIERYSGDAGQLYNPNYLGAESVQPPRSFDVTLRFTF